LTRRRSQIRVLSSPPISPTIVDFDTVRFGLVELFPGNHKGHAVRAAHFDASLSGIAERPLRILSAAGAYRLIYVFLVYQGGVSIY
jgi:hypothetical protein